MAYSEKVIDHYENPRNVGSMDKNDPNVATGMVGAPACGDVMKLQLKISDAGIIEDAKFKTYGCGSAIASSSLVTEWVKGKSIDEAGEIKNTAIAEELALPPVKIHCSILAEDAIKAAIEDYRTKHNSQAGRLMSVTMTPAASDRVKSFIENRGKGLGLRLGIKTTGCSGLAYVLEFVDDLNEDDTLFSINDVNIIIDGKSLVYLDGIELDFVKEGLNEGFKFTNPNAKGECGCGESFNV